MQNVNEPRLPSEPSLVTSLGRIVEAGQRIVVNRIDLARFDILDVVSRTLRGGAMVMIGSVVLLVGWLELSLAAILLGADYMSLPASAAAVGLLNAAAGAVLVTLGTGTASPDGSARAGKSNGES